MRFAEKMREMFARSVSVLGEKATEKLFSSRVVLFGLGGVGGHAAEALIRGGIGEIVLIDGDTFSESNINRQIFSSYSVIGCDKVEVAKKRLLDISPDLKISVRKMFWKEENGDMSVFDGADYIVDAIDDVPAKVGIIAAAKERGIRVISCMGTGNKTDPAAFRVADIEKTDTCPLARKVRLELRKRGIKGVKAVFSTEKPCGEKVFEGGKHSPGSVSFVPGVAGMIMAGEVIKDLVKDVYS